MRPFHHSRVFFSIDYEFVMKKYTFFLAGLLMWAGCSDSSTSSSGEDLSDYYPLHVGDKWEYSKEGSNETASTDSIIGLRKINGYDYYVEETIYPNPDTIVPPFLRDTSFIRYSSPGVVNLISRNYGSSTYIDFNNPQYSKDAFYIFGRNDSISVPAGKFDKCIDLRQRIYSVELISLVCAKGVGLVQISSQGGRYVLKSAIINGKNYP